MTYQVEIREMREPDGEPVARYKPERQSEIMLSLHRAWDRRNEYLEQIRRHDQLRTHTAVITTSSGEVF